MFNYITKLITNTDDLMDNPLMYVVSSCFIFSCFVIGGYNKLNNMEDIADLIKTKLFFTKLPHSFSQLASKITVIIELVLPFIIILAILNNVLNKNKYSSLKENEQREKKNSFLTSLAKLSTIIIILFTFVITFVFHHPSLANERMSFLKNMGLIGGMLMIYNYL